MTKARSQYVTQYGATELSDEEADAYRMCCKGLRVGNDICAVPDFERFKEPLDMLHKRFTARAKAYWDKQKAEYLALNLC